MLHLRGLKHARPFWMTYFLRTPPIWAQVIRFRRSAAAHIGLSPKVSTVFPHQPKADSTSATQPFYSLCVCMACLASLFHKQTHKSHLAHSLTPIHGLNTLPRFHGLWVQTAHTIHQEKLCFLKTQMMNLKSLHKTVKFGYFGSDNLCISQETKLTFSVLHGV